MGVHGACSGRSAALPEGLVVSFRQTEPARGPAPKIVEALTGDYDRDGVNHGKPVYRRRRNGGRRRPDSSDEVYIYYFESGEADKLGGWWFGSQVGGDKVWAGQEVRSACPLETKWDLAGGAGGPADLELIVKPRWPVRSTPCERAAASVQATVEISSSCSPSRSGSRSHSPCSRASSQARTGPPSAGAVEAAAAAAAATPTLWRAEGPGTEIGAAPGGDAENNSQGHPASEEFHSAGSGSEDEGRWHWRRSPPRRSAAPTTPPRQEPKNERSQCGSAAKASRSPRRGGVHSSRSGRLLRAQAMQRTVDLSRMGLDDEGLRRWIAERGPQEVQQLGPGPLDYVDASHNALTDEGVGLLVDFLRAQRRATRRLSLHHNRLREPSAICRLVEDARFGAGTPDGLAQLHLSHNSLQPAAVEGILGSLQRCARSRGALRPPFWLRVECNDGVEDLACGWEADFGRRGLRICTEGAPRSPGCNIGRCKRGADVHLNVVDRSGCSSDSKPRKPAELRRGGSGRGERADGGGEPRRGGGEPKRVELRKGDREIRIVAYDSRAAAASRPRHESRRERSRSRSRSPVRIEVVVVGGRGVAKLSRPRAGSHEATARTVGRVGVDVHCKSQADARRALPDRWEAGSDRREAPRNRSAVRLTRPSERRKDEDSWSRQQDGDRHSKRSDSWSTSSGKDGRRGWKRDGQAALGWTEGDRRSGRDAAKESDVAGPVTGPLPFWVQVDGQDLDDEGLRIRLAQDIRPVVQKSGERPIENLNLSGNQLTDEGVRTVVDFLVEERKPAWKLRLHHNSLREPDFRRLLEDDKLGPGAAEGLKELHLSNNTITRRGVRAILESLLKRRQRLGKGFQPPLWLRMEHNRRLTKAAVRGLAKEYEDHGLSVCFNCIPREKHGCSIAHCRHCKDVHIFVGSKRS